MNKLELLSYAEKFIVTKFSDGYEIKDKNENVAAYIYSDNTIEYYVTDCYNSGTDYVEFDIEAVLNLKAFCELMMEGEDENF